MSELLLADVARPQSAAESQRTALVFADRKTSYGELNVRANQVANGLIACDLKVQERVALLDHSSDQFYEIWLGCGRANLALTPLNARLSPSEIIQVLADCQSPVLFIGPAFIELLPELKAQLSFIKHFIVLGEQYANWRDQQSSADCGRRVAPRDDCLQIYTSGTTGLPKGVRLCGESIFKAPLSSRVNGGLSPCQVINAQDTVLLCLPHAHVAGSILGLYGLASGSKIVIVRDFIPAEIAAIIEREQVSMTLMVPIMVRGLIAAMAQTDRPCLTLTQIMYGAAPMATALLKDAMAALPHAGFTQIYGLTETSGPITFLTEQDHHAIAQGDENMAHSCGRATAGLEVRVIDEFGQTLANGDIGEIICRSTQTMNGYWQREEETQKAIQDGWFHTGDMGYQDDQGYFYIYDRKRDMIITGGENVYPAEVENILYSHPAIADIAIIGVPDPQWGEAIKAVVILKPNAALSEAELIAYAKEHVAGFKAPKTVDFVSELPRNATGKVLRRMIREPYWKNHKRGVA